MNFRFPRNTYFGLGATLIVMGILLFLLGIASLVTSLVLQDECGTDSWCDDTDWELWTVFSAPAIVGGVLFIIAGSLAVAASRTDLLYRMSGLSVGAMVMSVFATFWGLAVVILGVLQVIYASEGGESADDYWLAIIILSGIIAAVALISSIVAIATAAHACCSTPIYDCYIAMPPTVPSHPHHHHHHGHSGYVTSNHY